MDKELQEKIISKVRKLRLLIDRVAETPIRHRMDDLLCRVYLQARDGNEDAAPVRTKDLTDDEVMACRSSDPAGGSWLESARAVIAADRELNK